MASTADGPDLGALKVDAWRQAYAGFMPAELLAALDPDEEAADWSEYVRTMPPDHRLWVVDSGSAVTGFCRTGPADQDTDLGRRAAEVYGLYISPDLIGTGLGRGLFGKAVADLDARGFDPICVYAYEPNVRAIRFYEQAGFAPDGATRLDESDNTGTTKIRLVR
ncbi:GNAT family N-acetyltransferase [Fodinicola acaciae]|uniref:GNAT family N-acetyltransferase n=1 Tax=Fodinicola acaciae TaxID=2681555 RepID=UPI0013D6565F|nr:GNAT family N-acetyltransferase [Fodinicola acaciae]